MYTYELDSRSKTPKSALLEAFQHFGISSSAISIRTIMRRVSVDKVNFTCRVQLPSIPRENFYEQVLPSSVLYIIN
jgi:hypothetical protein